MLLRNRLANCPASLPGLSKPLIELVRRLWYPIEDPGAIGEESIDIEVVVRRDSLPQGLQRCEHVDAALPEDADGRALVRMKE